MGVEEKRCRHCGEEIKEIEPGSDMLKEGFRYTHTQGSPYCDLDLVAEPQCDA